jgi:hypothetical protein
MHLVFAPLGTFLRFATAPPHGPAPLTRVRHTRPIKIIIVIVFLVTLFAHQLIKVHLSRSVPQLLDFLAISVNLRL